MRCQGLLASDPNLLEKAVAHYRAAGPAVELPAALEDLAGVLAGGGHEEAARSALNEAVSLYQNLQGPGAIRRGGGRLGRVGIKSGPLDPGRRGRALGPGAVS